jgi:tetratricopeptide (TPR) repeat protein
VELAGNRPEAAKPQPKFAAYEAFLKGRHLTYKITPDGMTRAQEYFEQAIALDPTYPDPHYFLGCNYLLAALLGLQPPRQAFPLVRTQAANALSADARFSPAHALLGCVAALHDYDWVGAGDEFRMAFAGPTVPPDVRFWYGFLYLAPLQRYRESIEQFEIALESDPLNVLLRNFLACTCFTAALYQRSLDELSKAREIDPSVWLSELGVASNKYQQGKIAESLSVCEKVYEMAPWSAPVLAHAAALNVCTGNASRGEALLAQLRQLPSHTVPWGMAIFHAICSEVEEAARWAELTIKERDPMAPILLWQLRSRGLHTSSRWPSLLRMMNLSDLL